MCAFIHTFSVYFVFMSKSQDVKFLFLLNNKTMG